VSHLGVFDATDLRTGQARWTLPWWDHLKAAAGAWSMCVDTDGKLICRRGEPDQITGSTELCTILDGFGTRKRRTGFLGIRRPEGPQAPWSKPIPGLPRRLGCVFVVGPSRRR